MAAKLLNATQEAVLNSNRATESHVDENISIISGIAAFITNYNGIKTNIAGILEFANLKGASRTVALRKNDLRERLGNEVLKFAGVVETFADDTSDLQLLDDMKIKPSQLERIRDDELAPLCQFIHDRAQPHAAALKDYNIQAADFTALQTLISDYSAEVPKPRTIISQRKTNNANIAVLFKDNEKRFKNLDKQIETLRVAHPDFVNTYFTTRNVVDPTPKSKKSKEVAKKDDNKTN
ncbi:MAG: hypothetical protein WA584_06005 [Pyrinomonadaceae bacterium]